MGEDGCGGDEQPRDESSTAMGVRMERWDGGERRTRAMDW